MTRKQKTIITGVTTTGEKTAVSFDPRGPVCYECAFKSIGAGTVSATVYLQGSNDGSTYYTLATFTLSNAAPSGCAAFDAPYPYIRANVNAISISAGAAYLEMTASWTEE